jgi:hypothetical protein
VWQIGRLCEERTPREAATSREFPQVRARVGHGSGMGRRRGRVLRGSRFDLLDGLGLARSAFHHSVNYRSVVVQHGCGRGGPTGEDRGAGRSGRSGGAGQDRWYSAAFRKRAGGNDDSSAGPYEVLVKISTGPPDDDPEDLGLPYWAGGLPLITSPGTPQPSDDLPGRRRAT